MKPDEISIHELKVFLVLRDNKTRWLTNADIAGKIAGVAARTVRAHTAKLVRAGLVEQVEAFPGYRFRLAPKSHKRSNGYLLQLEKAREVFGL